MIFDFLMLGGLPQTKLVLYAYIVLWSWKGWLAHKPTTALHSMMVPDASTYMY